MENEAKLWKLPGNHFYGLGKYLRKKGFERAFMRPPPRLQNASQWKTFGLIICMNWSYLANVPRGTLPTLDLELLIVPRGTH